MKGGAREAGEDRALESDDALEPEDAPTGPKVDLYRGLIADVERLLEGERDLLANAANVVPIIKQGRLIGVVDLDSPRFGRFDADDQAGLEALVEVFLAKTEVGSGGG